MNREKLVELAQVLQLAESVRKEVDAIAVRLDGDGVEIHMLADRLLEIIPASELTVGRRIGTYSYRAFVTVEGVTVFALLTERGGQKLIAEGAAVV